MKSHLAIVTSALIGVSCAKQNAVPTQSPASASVGVIFEIRDFKLTQEQGELSADYRGRGTLVTRDQSLLQKNVMVWLSVRRTTDADETFTKMVLMRDGIGTIETRDFVAKSDAEKTKVSYGDWKIIGYTVLQPGTLSSN